MYGKSSTKDIFLDCNSSSIMHYIFDIMHYVYSVSLVLLTSEGYGPYETNLYNLYSLNGTCEPALYIFDSIIALCSFAVENHLKTLDSELSRYIRKTHKKTVQ